MGAPPVRYTEYHPRWLRRPVSTYWWLERRTYFTFILRELSSVFVGWSVVYLLMIVGAVAQGEAAFAALLDWSARPGVLALNVVTLVMVTFHAITWFNLAPQAMAVRVGRTRVSGRWITASNYLAWAVVSGGLALLLLGG